MDPVKKELLFQQWSKVNEITLIKIVALKGQHVNLCLEFLSKKKKKPLEDAIEYFHEIVDTYVYRLLCENSLSKAQQVLQNVSRDYKSIYFQFAIESTDEIRKNAIFDYLKKENENFEKEKEKYEYYFEVLKEVKNEPKLSNPIKRKLKMFNLENFFKMDKKFQNDLVIRLYFFNKNSNLLDLLSKEDIWKYLIDENLESEIILWCKIQKGESCEINNTLHQKYVDWKIDNDMFSYVSKYLKTSNEELRDLFLYFGFIFDDEKNDVKKLSDRIMRTKYANSLDKNIGQMSFPIAEYLLQNNCLEILLENFIQIEDIENLKKSYPDKIDLFDLIIELKLFDEPTPESYIKISQLCVKVLEKKDKNFLENNPFVALAEFLVAGKEIETLKDDDSREARVIKSIPFINYIIKRLHDDEPPIDPQELFKKRTGIDLKEMGEKEFGGEPALFTNPHMMAKYGMKFEFNYTHFVRQYRSSYAVYRFLMDQISTYGTINKTHFHSAVHTISNMAIAEYKDLQLTRNCVIFIEQLGFDSQNLRCLLCALRLCNYDELKTLDYKDIIATAEEKLLGDAENIEKIYETHNFPVEDYSAIIRVAEFSGKKFWPQKYLNFLVGKDDWFRLLLFLQFFDFPLDVIKNVCKNFKTTIIGDNFYRAVSFEGGDQLNKSSNDTLTEAGQKRRPNFKRNRTYKSDRKQKTVNESPSETLSGQSSKNFSPYFKSNNDLSNKCLEDKDDLVAHIILSSTDIPEDKITSFENFLEIMNDSNSYCTSINLLKKCIKYKRSILSVLSAEANCQNVNYCWLVWLSVSANHFDTLIKISSKKTKEFIALFIESIVKNHYIQTLYRSFFIFYDNNIIFLLKFLKLTNSFKFKDECIVQFKNYFDSWSNNEISIPFVQFNREEILIFTIRIVLLHLQNNFRTQQYQFRLLEVIVKANIQELSDILDFDILKSVFELIMGTDFKLNFEALMPLYSWNTSIIQNTYNEYKNLLDAFLESKEFDKAIKLAYLIESVLDKPISNIIFTKWVTELDLRETKFNFDQYEKDTVEHSLPTEFLVNFYLYAAVQFPDTDFTRYLWYKNALEVIKKNKLFRNESVDRDQIEFDMIMTFLKSEKNIDEITIYHSEYYEEILSKERFVLYKSYLELKELAGTEELTTSLKTPLTSEMKSKLTKLLDYLLEKSDIVQAFRLQSMFENPINDLSYLKFCMALAEGLTTLDELTEEQKYFFINVDKSTTMFSKKTLEERKVKEQKMLTANRKRNADSGANLDFVEIPSKEKQNILDTIQGMIASLKFGTNIGKRIVIAYRTAMYLDKEYMDILRTKDTSTLLASATSDDCLKKLFVINDIFTSTQMTPTEIAEYLSHEITTAVVRPVFYLLTADQQNVRQIKPTLIWGYDLEKEFHLILELCPKPSLLGEYLLKYCDILTVYRRFQNNEEYESSAIFDSFYNIISNYGLPNEPSTSAGVTQQVLSYKKKNTIYIELLIIAYKCFVHECHMEGMINVLNRSQKLNIELEQAKSWKLICRMLTGIEQYREMSYCFNTLLKNDQFECLLSGQYDKEKSQSLKNALLSYLREFCPNLKEHIKLVAIHFGMYTEIAEMWINDTNSLLSQILAKYEVSEEKKNNTNGVKQIKCSLEVVKELEQVRDGFANAAENYLQDNKLRNAGKYAQRAQLIALQLGILNHNLKLTCCKTGTHNLCVCIVNVESRKTLRELATTKLNSCFQTMILLNSYPEYPIEWHEILLWQYVILNNENYLEEYNYKFELNDYIIENIVKGYANYCKTNVGTTKMEENLEKLVVKIKSITLKYRLASHMSFKKVIVDMLNDENVIYYLKDTNYGKNEVGEDI